MRIAVLNRIARLDDYRIHSLSMEHKLIVVIICHEWHE